MDSMLTGLAIGLGGPLFVYLLTYAYYTARGEVVYRYSKLDLTAREAYNEKIVAKLERLGKGSEATAAFDYVSRDPFSNLN